MSAEIALTLWNLLVALWILGAFVGAIVSVLKTADRWQQHQLDDYRYELKRQAELISRSGSSFTTFRIEATKPTTPKSKRKRKSVKYAVGGKRNGTGSGRAAHDKSR